jgi:hypothetical protein
LSSITIASRRDGVAAGVETASSSGRASPVFGAMNSSRGDFNR